MSFKTTLMSLALAMFAGCAVVPSAPPVVAPVAEEVTSPEPPPPPKIALVLGGGAAKGFAHIGVIKALESHAITPDIIVAAPKYTRFEQELFRADVFYPAEAGVGGFTRAYLGGRPTITHEFTADDEVMHQFRNYLTKHNVRFSETEIAENQDWIKRKIKQEVFMSTFGMQEGFKVLLEADPQLQRGVEAMPQARALYQNARKIVAQRTGGTIDQP